VFTHRRDVQICAISCYHQGVPDILIRDLPDHVVASIDANAKRLGLSRNEYLRRQLAGEARAQPPRRKVTAKDLKRFTSLISDINDPEVMAGAWD
jgi:hypothetical protein